MIDIKSVREEMARIHAEATAHVEKYASTEATAEEQTAQDERFLKLEKMQRSIDDATKLAKFAYTKEEPVSAVAVKPTKGKDQVAVEAYHAQSSAPAKLDRQAYAAQLSAWARGDSPEAYASITTTSGGGAMLPSVVKAGINLIAANPYRKALAAVGLSPVSFGTTAKVTSPVISPFAGQALPEDGSAETNSNANAKLGVLTHTPSGWQSTSFWYSNLELAALDYDLTQSNLPALAGATDRGFAVATSAAIKADAAITQSVTTATTSTLTLDNLDDLNNAVDPVFDAYKAIHLSKSAYIAAEKLKDSTGMPILSRDVQDQSLLKFKGTPVIKDDTLDAMGTSGNMVGMLISYVAFQIRDEDEKVLRYVNDADRPDKTGLNHIAYRDAAYVPAAIVKFKN